MATMDYVDVPPGAIRLRNPPNSATKNDDVSEELRPLPKIVTSLPRPSPPPSPTSFKRKSLLASTAESLASPTLSLIPQLLLSSTLPPTTDAPNGSTSSPRKKGQPVLLSSKDPLSLPIMSVNFKRFVSIVGPVFWLQDRIEEILFWKRGWMRTAVWMSAYVFLCFYPRLLLLLPHIALMSIILSTYPYPNSASDQAVPNVPPTEGSIPWQANIQGIQNLMGIVADVHDVVQPYMYHLYLAADTGSAASVRQSPYTQHILTLLFLSFFPLLFVINLPHFPIREVCLVIGLTPFILTHPFTRRIFPVLLHAAAKSAPLALLRLQELKDRATSALRRGKSEPEEVIQHKKEPPLPFSMVLQRIMDDDRLSDECWNSEMREVELWENERWGGPLPTDSSAMVAATASSSSITPPQKGWSKQNLRPGERTGWTRGRDGWNGGGPGGSGNIVEGSGEVSSNLTFSLAPGWAFVESEDWRKDLQCEWSGCGGDLDGWVYTNDSWLGARPAPYTSGGGSVTRRRRWVRRVWYDPKRAIADS